MSSTEFKNLAELCKVSCERFENRSLFGTKKDGGWNWISYGDFYKQVEAARGGLAALGVGPGDKVGCIADNRVEWAVGAYATYGLGATYVPMYQAQKASEWRFILNDCGAKLVFCATEKIHTTLSDMKGELDKLEHVIGFDLADDHDESFAALLKNGADNPTEMAAPGGDDLAGFIYTSGTTGNPKGVMLSHNNIVSNVLAVHSVFPIESGDRSLSFLPWAHAFGQTCELHCLLSLGASLAINDEIPNLVGNLAEVKPSILYAVPRIFNRIYDGVNKQISGKPPIIQKLFRKAISVADRKSQGQSVGLFDKLALALADRLIFEKIRQRFGGRLRYAISGSAALSTDVAKFIDALGIMVYEGYGLSETSPIATCNFPGARKIGSVGKAIPDVRIHIDKTVTGDDKKGEIVIYGPNVMQGYHNRPEEQAKSFTDDGGFKSGDTGWIDDDGFLFIAGRIKEQYKLENGKYVMPAPLEESLKLSPFISNVMLDGANRPFNIAVIVPDHPTVDKWAKDEGHSVSSYSKDEKLRKLIEDEIGKFGSKFKGYERPKKLLIVDEEFTTENDMLTPTMKLKRAKVMEKYEADINALYSS
jgi:long-chain acyl-CoA synthetase